MYFKILTRYQEQFGINELKRGDFIYHEGETPEFLYFVLEGLIGLFHISEGGKETFLRVFGPHELFGHRSYLANEVYHATTACLTKVKIAKISREDWQKIQEDETDISNLLLESLAKDLGKAELRLAGLVDKTASSRIAEALLFLKLKHPEKVWTRKEIAEFSGSTFETVARVMGQLDELGHIKKSGRDFEIINQDQLIQFGTV